MFVLYILILVIIVIVGYFLSKNWKTELLGHLLIGFPSAMLALLLVVTPLIRLDQKSYLKQMEVVQAQVDIAREGGNELELAAIQIKIQEMNQELADAKFYAEMKVFDPFWVDEINEAEYIK